MLPTCPIVAKQRVEHLSHLGRRQAESDILPFLRDHLHTRPGRARHLPPLARLELYVVHHRTEGNPVQRKRVAHANVGIRA